MGRHAGVSSTHDLLNPRYIAALRTFAHSSPLLAFDYDGTLSPIAPTPERARLPPATRRLLIQVAARYPLVVISGRGLVDISARVADLGARYVFGNHGLEWSGGASSPHAHVHQWAHQLRSQLAGLAGVIVEDKAHSLSVHYRSAPDHDRALRLILPAARALSGVRIICGAAAVNLLPKDAANKGVALRRAIEATGCVKAIYVGDDETDEDAFAALTADRLLSIRIGPSATSRASFHLDSQ
jgi:trehalose 6-phosphate phosphatase